MDHIHEFLETSARRFGTSYATRKAVEVLFCEIDTRSRCSDYRQLIESIPGLLEFLDGRQRSFSPTDMQVPLGSFDPHRRLSDVGLAASRITPFVLSFGNFVRQHAGPSLFIRTIGSVPRLRDLMPEFQVVVPNDLDEPLPASLDLSVV